MEKSKLTVGPYTVTARVDELGLLRLSIDAGEANEDLFQVCNLFASWTDGDASVIIVGTDRRIGVAEGVFRDDKASEEKLRRSIMGDQGFRKAFAALGEEAQRLVAHELKAAAERVTAGVPSHRAR